MGAKQVAQKKQQASILNFKSNTVESIWNEQKFCMSFVRTSKKGELSAIHVLICIVTHCIYSAYIQNIFSSLHNDEMSFCILLHSISHVCY
jgi:hypothetical protein